MGVHSDASEYLGRLLLAMCLSAIHSCIDHGNAIEKGLRANEMNISLTQSFVKAAIIVNTIAGLSIVVCHDGPLAFISDAITDTRNEDWPTTVTCTGVVVIDTIRILVEDELAEPGIARIRAGVIHSLKAATSGSTSRP